MLIFNAHFQCSFSMLDNCHYNAVEGLRQKKMKCHNRRSESMTKLFQGLWHYMQKNSSKLINSQCNIYLTVFNCRKLDNGEIDDVLLLDLQLMKFTRVTVDLAYFFGSSSFYKFRAEHLDGLLKVYHKKLIQELAIFGYPKSVYTFEKFLSDYEDTWVFGFVMGCMHIQVSVNALLKC
jgi:hypothetical protein